MTYRGRVVIERRGGRSKSARDAVVLQTAEGESFVLRMPGGNPFSDPRLDALIGKTIRAEGVVHGDLLILSRWEEKT